MEIRKRYSIQDLKEIMKMLRGENGCPWDKVQTHQSIRNNFLEETYETIEAIDCGDSDMLREELGDVLLQVIFHSQLESEVDKFCFDDVVNDICEKLIVRHPHVFSDVVVENEQQVMENWNAIKNDTKGVTTATETLRSVPKQLPALMRSQKIQGRARKAGFDYTDVKQALSDLKSEIAELEQAIELNEGIGQEMGDVLFSSVNVSRLLDVEAEEVLYQSCDKFVDRFEIVEKLSKESELDLKELNAQQLDDLWKQAKRECSRV